MALGIFDQQGDVEVVSHWRKLLTKKGTQCETVLQRKDRLPNARRRSTGNRRHTEALAS